MMRRFFYFVLLVPICWLCLRWVWELACESAGVKRQRVWRYLHGVHVSSCRGKRTARWLERRSPNPKRTRKLLYFYYIGMAPAILCAFFAFVGTSTRLFDPILRFGAVVFPVLALVSVVAKICYGKRHPGSVVNQGNWNAFKEYLAYLRHRANRDGVRPFQKKHGGGMAKYIAVCVLKVAVAAGVLAGLFFLLVNLGTPKTPATAQQAWEMLTEQGYEPCDITEQCQNAWNAEQVLEQAVSVEGGGLRFDFYVMTDSKSAVSLWRQYNAHIRQNRYSRPNVEFQEKLANYQIYTIEANGEYTVNMRVDHTVVYAYCEEEEIAILQNMLKQIGYFEGT